MTYRRKTTMTQMCRWNIIKLQKFSSRYRMRSFNSDHNMQLENDIFFVLTETYLGVIIQFLVWIQLTQLSFFLISIALTNRWVLTISVDHHHHHHHQLFDNVKVSSLSKRSSSVLTAHIKSQNRNYLFWLNISQVFWGGK